ncbi:CPBP family glutamic-type intramembrane protease [Enterococcus sp. LJL128]|uniref:CPBP family glutamic-type intramembrane protease n=1 Tax=Enterococcus sp. LJL51 TaxID=3416656 RepID=UPI003CEE19AB
MKEYFWFEKKDDDFPFYRNLPYSVAGWQWLVMLLFPFLGFLSLTVVYIPSLSIYENELFSGIVLVLSGFLGLFLAVGKDWKKLFRRIYPKEILLVIGYVLGAILFASLLGGIIELLSGTLADNPAATNSEGKAALMEYLLLRFQEIFQLFGEEFLAIIPFLAVLHLMVARWQLRRKTAVIIAWIVSSVVFGLLHLPTYDWNIIQCVFLIGGSRMVLTLPYIQTKNIWISYFVHYLYDMLIFTAAFLS